MIGEWYDSLTDKVVNVYFIWIPYFIIGAFITLMVLNNQGTFEGIVVGLLFIIIFILMKIFLRIKNRQ